MYPNQWNHLNGRYVVCSIPYIFNNIHEAKLIADVEMVESMYWVGAKVPVGF